MSADSPMPHNATSRSPSEQEALHIQADFLWQALKETANLLMKAIAFFLAIAAAILGYVLSHPVANSVRNIACWTVITIAVIFAMTLDS